MQIKAKALAAIKTRCQANFAAGSWGQADSLAVLEAMATEAGLDAAQLAEFSAMADMVVNPAAAHSSFVKIGLLADLGKKRGSSGDKFAALKAAITTTP